MKAFHESLEVAGEGASIMRPIILDALDYAHKLKGGFIEQQAETQARILAEVVEK